VAAWQAQEFLRRVLYTEGRFAEVFANDLISYAGQVAVVGVLWLKGVLNQDSVFYAIALTSVTAASIGLWQLRRSLALHFDFDSVRENWALGKWFGAGSGSYWIATQLYTGLAAVLIGVAQVGTLRAAQLLFGPLNVLMAFLDGVLPRRFAQSQVEPVGHMRALFRKAHLATLPWVVPYCLFIAIFATPVLRLIYGRKYEGSGGLIVLFAVYYFAMYWATIVCAALRSKGMSQAVFRAYFLGSLTLVAVGAVLMMRLSIEGAVLGSILSALVLNAAFWRAYLHSASIEGATPRITTAAPVEL
jgi:O-antigen/teichoic acid export membrane protein